VPTSLRDSSDATSHISTALLTEIRIHLMYAIPRAAPLPMVPVRTLSTLKSISRTMHLQVCELPYTLTTICSFSPLLLLYRPPSRIPNHLTLISPPPTYGSLVRLVGGG
jgi:hypothetical protein